MMVTLEFRIVVDNIASCHYQKVLCDEEDTVCVFKKENICVSLCPSFYKPSWMR